MGEFVAACSLETLRMISFGLLRGSIVLILIMLDVFFGRSWLVLLAGGICHGALVVILMLPTSPMKGWGLRASVQP